MDKERERERVEKRTKIYDSTWVTLKPGALNNIHSRKLRCAETGSTLVYVVR